MVSSQGNRMDASTINNSVRLIKPSRLNYCEQMHFHNDEAMAISI